MNSRGLGSVNEYAIVVRSVFALGDRPKAIVLYDLRSGSTSTVLGISDVQAGIATQNEKK